MQSMQGVGEGKARTLRLPPPPAAASAPAFSLSRSSVSPHSRTVWSCRPGTRGISQRQRGGRGRGH